jgi:serine/threonine protein kinase
VKELNREFHDQPDYIERFIKEIDYTKRLKENKHIIDILGENIDKDNNTFYYIMPYVKMNLDDYISRNNGLLSSEEQLYLVEQVFRCY